MRCSGVKKPTDLSEKNTWKLPVFDGQRSRFFRCPNDLVIFLQMSLRFVDEVRYSQQSCCTSIRAEIEKNLGW